MKLYVWKGELVRMADTRNGNFHDTFRDTPEFNNQIEHLAKLITKGQTGRGNLLS